MNLKRVDWDKFKLGGSDRTGSVQFQPPKKPDRRDNAAEVRESNRLSKRMQQNRKNEERFAGLPEEHQAIILAALKAACK